MAEMIVGVDFDNTIVSYDRLIGDEALRRGLISEDVRGSKKEIRDQIRQLPDGENNWQRVQASIYGPRMQDADLIDGVCGFFQACKKRNIQTYIISHKTKYANFDEAGVNLREAALDWMTQQHFFDDQSFGLSRDNVFFGATRLEKIAHIQRLQCSHFVDDLEEMYLEDAFPAHVEKFLYVPHGHHSDLVGVQAACSWQEIHGLIFSTSS